MTTNSVFRVDYTFNYGPKPSKGTITKKFKKRGEAYFFAVDLAKTLTRHQNFKFSIREQEF